MDKTEKRMVEIKCHLPTAWQDWGFRLNLKMIFYLKNSFNGKSWDLSNQKVLLSYCKTTKKIYHIRHISSHKLNLKCTYMPYMIKKMRHYFVLITYLIAKPPNISKKF